MANRLRMVVHRNLHKETWRWDDCQSRPDPALTFPRCAPRDPRIGQGWYDERASMLSVWDGLDWVSVPTD
jgi:hypothetical protein